MALSEEVKDQIKSLWAEGFTSGQIVAALPVFATRNTVLGIVQRAGLLGRPRDAEKVAKQREAFLKKCRDERALGVKRYDRPVPVTKVSLPHVGNIEDAPPPMLPVAVGAVSRSERKMKIRRIVFTNPTPPPAEGSVSYLEATSSQCGWPYGDPMDILSLKVCGRPRLQGCVYCKDHTRTAIRVE